MPKRTLPVINDGIDLSKVRIASPCDESWDDMVGDDRSRHCESCDKSVHNFASMTRQEIGELLQGEDVCGHLYMRKDGTFLTADCEVGLAALALEKARVNYHRLSALLVTGIAFITVALMSVMAPREKTEAVDEAFKQKVYEIRDKARFRGEPGAVEEEGGITVEDREIEVIKERQKTPTSTGEMREFIGDDGDDDDVSEKMREIFGDKKGGTAAIMGGIGGSSGD